MEQFPYALLFFTKIRMKKSREKVFNELDPIFTRIVFYTYHTQKSVAEKWTNSHKSMQKRGKVQGMISLRASFYTKM